MPDLQIMLELYSSSNSVSDTNQKSLGQWCLKDPGVLEPLMDWDGTVLVLSRPQGLASLVFDGKLSWGLIV